MTDLLPCPFCGGEAKICSGENIYIATCKDLECGCRHDWSASKEDAISRWNTRNQWQPIETAPRGKRVLLWFISVNPENIYAHQATTGEITSDGVWTASGVYHPVEIYTHWQPLPEPPEDG